MPFSLTMLVRRQVTSRAALLDTDADSFLTQLPFGRSHREHSSRCKRREKVNAVCKKLLDANPTERKSMTPAKKGIFDYFLIEALSWLTLTMYLYAWPERI